MAHNPSLEEQDSTKFARDNAGATFPDDSDTGEKMYVSHPDQSEEPLHWREVPEKVWLRILNHRDAPTKKGVVKIVTLQKRDGASIQSWTTPYITRYIDAMISIHKDHVSDTTYLYIKSLGKAPCSADSTKSFFDIQLKHL